MRRKICAFVLHTTVALACLASGTLASTSTSSEKRYLNLPTKYLTGATAASEVEGAGPKADSVLSGEPDSVKENFGDWSVECRPIESIRQCRLDQSQEDTRSGRIVVAIQITPDAAGGGNAMLLLPLGLQMSDGVQFKLDDKLSMERAYFATCLTAGCLVPVRFSAMSIAAVEKAEKLQIVQAAYGSREPILFSISLKGFKSAYERLMALHGTKI